MDYDILLSPHEWDRFRWCWSRIYLGLIYDQVLNDWVADERPQASAALCVQHMFMKRRKRSRSMNRRKRSRSERSFVLWGRKPHAENSSHTDQWSSESSRAVFRCRQRGGNRTRFDLCGKGLGWKTSTHPQQKPPEAGGGGEGEAGRKGLGALTSCGALK